jgi:hypothetical protein
MTIKIGSNKSNFPILFRPEKTTFLFHFPNFPWFARGTSSNNYSIHLPEIFGDIIGIPMASKVLATEACFFVTVFSCSLLRALITSGPEMAKMGGVLRFSFGLVLWQI